MRTRLLGIQARFALLLAAGLGSWLAGCAATGGRGAGGRDAGANGGGLYKCVLLIPLAYNDGTAVPTEVLAAIEDRLFERYGGYSVAGRVSGAYRMADGSRAVDESLEIWVAVPRERVGELRREAGRIARELRQESLYFEVGEAGVEFVRPETP